ncbi:MAG: DUF11 domain-containing protein [Candidatus Peribacteria bacterium]|nr:DUF11 domain-containing protein [Candidatus Peribacteria bacterium]
MEIWEESAAKEDTMVNNEAVSSTMVYLADVMIEKRAIVDSNGDGVFSGDDSTEAVRKGKRIKYRVSYENIGNYSAENVVLRDSLPADTCFVIGSVNAPRRSWIEYSSDKGMSWSYVSNKADGEEDCAITDFRIVLADKLAAPGHSVEGGLYGTEGWEDMDAVLSNLPVTKNYSYAVERFTIQGIVYLAFANGNQKNEVWKWNGEGFSNISDKIPDSMYVDGQGYTEYISSHGVTSFQI